MQAGTECRVRMSANEAKNTRSYLVAMKTFVACVTGVGMGAQEIRHPIRREFIGIEAIVCDRCFVGWGRVKGDLAHLRIGSHGGQRERGNLGAWACQLT